jgi:hypothetical protein
MTESKCIDFYKAPYGIWRFSWWWRYTVWTEKLLVSYIYKEKLFKTLSTLMKILHEGNLEPRICWSVYSVIFCRMLVLYVTCIYWRSEKPYCIQTSKTVIMLKLTIKWSLKDKVHNK